MLQENKDSASDLIGAGRVVCKIQYDGSAFHGWQMQRDNLPSVQQSLQKALSMVANEPIELVCAGRTDAKVHATGQIVHFDTTVTRSRNSWLKGVNTYLPTGICLSWLDNTTSDFHARFSATARRYRYLIYNDAIKPALMSHLLTWSYWPLDAARMHEAAQSLVGENDFSSFRAAECQSNTPFRNVHFINVSRKNKLIEVDIQANAFLHHMVRNIVGVLMQIGSERAPVNWIDEVLHARDRRKGGVTAPPFGLYLVKVIYPDHFSIPEEELGPYFLNM
ncbi:MAG: tRNA pseudouridine(38-40) synthase TruA [Hahellaceae bacterium]|jgi:tRNA pseudouridine38-40 synthase|nr:tRNA pseudouridine(38-40) synthase TruA [Hahellaceae bacterium]MCP5212895.1 tRNA pseudouridine(38-40) synthase TruA [Hahellaceae bacterium]